MDKLTGVVVFKKFWQVVILDSWNVRYFWYIRCYMIIFFGFVEGQKRVGVNFAVQGGICLCGYPHRFQPVCSRGLYMEDPACLTAYGRKHAEFIWAGMDAQFISKTPRNRRVNFYFFFKLSNVALVVDALLELAAETRRYGRERNSFVQKLAGDKEMLKRCCNGNGLIYRDFKVRVILAWREKLFVYFRRELYRVRVNGSALPEFPFVKSEGNSILNIKFFI